MRRQAKVLDNVLNLLGQVAIVIKISRDLEFFSGYFWNPYVIYFRE